MIYPLIKLPFLLPTLKNSMKTICRPLGNKAPRCGKRPSIISGIPEADRINITVLMRRQWGLPMVTGPVKVSMIFKVPSYPGHNRYDLSNSRQLLEDLLQEQKEHFDQKLFKHVITRVGSDIIQDDGQIQSLDGTRFWWLCEYCESGKTGKRSTRKKLDYPCPGTKKCKYSGIEIIISDWVYPIPTPPEIDCIFNSY